MPESLEEMLRNYVDIGERGEAMSDADVDSLMERTPQLFRALARAAGYVEPNITKVITKFRDAGRRSPPTQAHSSIGLGGPQSGSDGNRTNRWLLSSDHKYYAEKRTAELVEIRYFLQALSLRGAPTLGLDRADNAFVWLLGHELRPDAYQDPIMLGSIDFESFLDNPVTLEAGHLQPLNRGGRHEPRNTFLMLARSNTLQNDLTFDEFLALIDDILRRQADAGIFPDPAKLPAHAFLEGTTGAVIETD